MKKFMENYLGVVVLYLVLALGAYIVSTNLKSTENIDHNKDNYQITHIMTK